MANKAILYYYTTIRRALCEECKSPVPDARRVAWRWILLREKHVSCPSCHAVFTEMFINVDFAKDWPVQGERQGKDKKLWIGSYIGAKQ